jgi:hypothetical protein
MDYKEALENSPVWVKQAYAEFSKLPLEKQKKTPFLFIWYRYRKAQDTI